MHRNTKNVDRRMSVLSAPGPGDPMPNDYNRLLIRQLELHAFVAPFSWISAIFGKQDVIHIHWPDALLHGTTRIKRAAKRLLLFVLVLLGRLRLRRIVWTVHNDLPHEKLGRFDSFLMNLWPTAVSGEIHLSDLSAQRSSNPSRTIIPHGLYELTPTGANRSSDLLISIGVIRAYKGLDDLMRAFAQTGHDLRLFVAGESQDEALAERLRKLASPQSRVTFEGSRLTDQEVSDALSMSLGVVIPYKRLGNSGVALLALSAGRPILVPASDVATSLQREFGEDWVHVFDHPISGEHLESFAQKARRTASTAPDLSGRDWHTIGLDHIQFFRKLGKDRP